MVGPATSTTDRIFHRRRRRRSVWVAILGSLASQHCCQANNNNDDDDATAYYDDDAYSSSTASSSSSSNVDISSSSSSKHDGYHDVQAFCRHNYVRVTGLWLTCDTPGAYYYGSGAYRSSEVCMSGDKANLRIEFTIPKDLKVETISLAIESGLYGKFQSVRNATSICSDLRVESTNSYGDECPNPGRYTMSTYFTMPSIRDYELHYTPDIKLIFTDPSADERIGCSTTGTVAIHRAAQDKSVQGMVALGVSVLAFCIIFAVLLYLSYQRKKRIEKYREQRYEQQLRDYHYFRTLPNGQVIPVSGPAGETVAAGTGGAGSIPDSNALVAAPPLRREGPTMVLIPSNPDSNHMGDASVRVPGSGIGLDLPHHRHRGGHDIASDEEEEDDDDDYEEDDLTRRALHISNPSYNEPQIPTRPII